MGSVREEDTLSQPGPSVGLQSMHSALLDTKAFVAAERDGCSVAVCLDQPDQVSFLTSASLTSCMAKLKLLWSLEQSGTQ